MKMWVVRNYFFTSLLYIFQQTLIGLCKVCKLSVFSQLPYIQVPGFLFNI